MMLAKNRLMAARTDSCFRGGPSAAPKSDGRSGSREAAMPSSVEPSPSSLVRLTEWSDDRDDLAASVRIFLSAANTHRPSAAVRTHAHGGDRQINGDGVRREVGAAAGRVVLLELEDGQIAIGVEHHAAILRAVGLWRGGGWVRREGVYSAPIAPRESPCYSVVQRPVGELSRTSPVRVQMRSLICWHMPASAMNTISVASRAR